ncbi:chemotaxis protein CheB [Methylotetracoccus oryzae]|uniref:chemotaxis protein CheB n=1 Tax=Methylotetracoccus oryzae TaxID=1919059 RepID=UPI0011181759|nr:chemotaxis protein CheB [Methylotetracoccus oryzae]
MATRKRRTPAAAESTATLRKETVDPEQTRFPIVGIGASAGGLEALQAFLQHVPTDSGCAFIVVQHLDPTHSNMLPELLQRGSALPVALASEGWKVAPNHVYVIPPNRDLSILHGVLHLFEPTESRGLRLPIDFFFRALAEDCGHSAVGVILSGMGSDGTQGLRAIKGKAGLTGVQTPASAKFDGMPRSAIDAGVADIIAPADELPVKLLATLRHGDQAGEEHEEPSSSALAKILILLRSHTGADFSQYKKTTLYRRIERRMGVHALARISDYVRFLRENPQELELLFRELLIGVTGFFRDPEVWEALKTLALPRVLEALPPGTNLRAWVPACSTGEEAYSLAIVLKEALEAQHPEQPVSMQIYATDLDAEAIEAARRGVYPKKAAADISPARLARFFVTDPRGYRISQEIRELVIFAPQNLLSDPPFTKLDILVCRNLLIYFTAEVQKKVVPLFHYSLNPGGILLLGSAETIGAFSDLFTPIEGKARLFQRNVGTPRIGTIEFPTSPMATPQAVLPQVTPLAHTANLQTLADQVLLRRHAPAAVLTTHQGDILYINGRTGNYLEPASGRANWNIYAMAREPLRFDLTQAFQHALRQKTTLTVPDLKLDAPQGTRYVTLTIEPLEQPEPLRGMVMIVFHERAEPTLETVMAPRRSSRRSAREAALEQEVEQLRVTIQTTREEMQSSQEELKSANEELQSTNEELQSTNEELTTSKEEMQSLNEELQTVNAELQSKIDDLSRASNDMTNLLNSTEIATVFLDSALHIRRFTVPASRIIKLIPSDAGRPLSDIVSDLNYPELYADAEEVLRTLVFSAKDVPTSDGRWFTVRIMPYRTAENVIDGVVITFADITVAKTLEAQLREAAS